MRFIPGWKDLLKTLWIALLFGGWGSLAIPIFESEWFVRMQLTNPGMAIWLTFFLAFVFPVCSVALIHHFLWGEDTPGSNWFPRRASWWEAVWVYCAFLVGAFTPVIVGLLSILAWNEIFKFAVINVSTTAEEMGRNDYFIGALAIAMFYIIALVMKLQRWTNRTKEKPPAKAEGKPLIK